MKKLRVVYFGTPDFSVPVLEMLHSHELVELISVVSMPDRPAGRGHQLRSPEVIEFCKKNKISFFQTDNINQEHSFLESLKEVDLFIVLAFAQFLSDKVLQVPKLGAFNIHTSLLPRFRGASPIHHAILNGDTKTGVSIQRMVKKMDAGDICFSHELNIPETQTTSHLYNRLKFQAAITCSDFIYSAAKNELVFTTQNEIEVTFAPTIKKTDGFLDFNALSFQEITNKIRAYHPWPGTYCILGNKRLKVFEIEKVNGSLSPGCVEKKYNQIHVGIKDCTIRLKFIQLEGKKACLDEELLNGFKNELVINPKGHL